MLDSVRAARQLDRRLGSRVVTAPVPLTAYVAMIVRSIDRADRSIDLRPLRSERGRALVRAAGSGCYPELGRPSSAGGFAPADLVRPGADIAPLVGALDRLVDTENLTIRGVPVRIEQGRADSTVFASLTDDLVRELRARGGRVEYAAYEGVEHVPVLAVGAAPATAWIDARLRRAG